MADVKTKATTQSVAAFLGQLDDKAKQADCAEIVRMMTRATGQKPAMWGSSIVGFGTYHYRYESGREGDMALVSFAPRKSEIVLYLPEEFPERPELLAKLGKHKTGKACLYIKKLADVDMAVLEKLVTRSVQFMLAKYK
jgi:hypothetical protein